MPSTFELAHEILVIIPPESSQGSDNPAHSCKSLSCSYTLRMDVEEDWGQNSSPEVIKLFSFSTQMSTKFQLLIKIKILTNEEVSCFKSLRCIYHANEC